MTDSVQMPDFEKIYNFLKENPQNYLGYKKLGEFYQGRNINQAYLCYEQARGICDDVEEKIILEKRMLSCKENPNFRVHPVSFIILSYNAKEMMIDCLESIRKGCVPGSYEIVVVDNDSQDGIRDYLVEQKDIVLQLNDHNTSFAAGCNQGVKLANPYNDIFLLNNDTIVPALALFYMRLALYEADDVGSVGPTSNMVMISQLAPGNYQTKEQWLENAANIHLPMRGPGENKAWLSGFALLIRRKAWDFIGNIDERFVKGNFEDVDYGFRLLMSGYRNVLCHNAFIYHYGSISMSKDPSSYNNSLKENERKLNDKLGVEFNRYMSCHEEMIAMMGDVTAGKKIKVLEVGCGFGLTLSKIKYKYPDAEVVGIENNSLIAGMGKRITNVICTDVETGVLPFEQKSFDYILLPNVVNYFENTKKNILKLIKYLKEDGTIVLLLKNPLYGEMIAGILTGKLETIRDSDPRIRHSYTRDEIIDLLTDIGIVPRFILKMVSENIHIMEEDRIRLKAIETMAGVSIGKDFNIVSYIISATLH